MLNILEGYDVAAMGFGSPDDDPSARGSAEDRVRRSRGGSGDPAFIKVPVERLIRRLMPRERRARIDPGARKAGMPG